MEKKNSCSTTLKIAAVALIFIIVIYQCALFVNRAAALHIEALRDKPDTVYIIKELLPAAEVPAGPRTAEKKTVKTDTVRKNAQHHPIVKEQRNRTRRVETFRFDPNTVSIDELVRLGFSEKQAAVIDNYRKKGGRFRRKSDFAKSFVVSDSVYARLEAYIDIPLIDINVADSAAFDALPGIGPYFAAKMVEYRERIGGYRSTEQLLEIYNFGQDRYDALKDLITVEQP